MAQEKFANGENIEIYFTRQQLVQIELQALLLSITKEELMAKILEEYLAKQNCSDSN